MVKLQFPISLLLPDCAFFVFGGWSLAHLCNVSPCFAWVGSGYLVPVLGGEVTRALPSSWERPWGKEGRALIPPSGCTACLRSCASKLGCQKAAWSLRLQGPTEPQFPLWPHFPSLMLHQLDWSHFSNIAHPLPPGLCPSCALSLECAFPRHPGGQLLQAQMSPSLWCLVGPPYLKLWVSQPPRVSYLLTRLYYFLHSTDYLP